MKTTLTILLALILLTACAQEAPMTDTTDTTDAGPQAPQAEPDTEIPEQPEEPAPGQNITNGETLARGELEVESSAITYYNNIDGFLAEPQDDGEYPGVVLVHEWWGLNDEVKDAAVTLASHGYRVLAVDLYNGEVATTSQEAQSLRTSISQEDSITNMRAAAAALRDRGSSQIASFGWCFGGGQALQFSLNEDVDATIIYYGQLETDPQRLEQLDGPVLGIFGEQDTSIPVATVRQFNQSLDQAGVDHQVYIYPGVGHAFANPSGMNYAPQQTADAWEKTLAFLSENLQ